MAVGGVELARWQANVGSLRRDRGAVTELLSMPRDDLAPLLQMPVTERFRFVVLTAVSP